MSYAARLLINALIQWLHNEYVEVQDPELLALHATLVKFRDNY